MQQIIPLSKLHSTVANVHKSLEGHLALLRVIKALNQAHHSAFAGARLSYEGNSLASRHLQGEVLEHRVLWPGWVCKAAPMTGSYQMPSCGQTTKSTI